MHKLDYFLKAIKSNCHENKAWVISCFAVTHEDVKAWERDPYPYRVVQTPLGSYFVDPDVLQPNPINLTPIEGYSIGTPIFGFKDRILLKAGDVENLDTDIETTLGNLLFNIICLVNAFGKKIPYINKNVSVSDLENTIAANLYDTPKEGEVREETKLYVDEYLKFVNGVFYLTNFSQLCVWGATEKVLTPPPGIVEFKEQLLKKYEGQLHDSSIIAKIDDELIKFDAEYLKGDPGENFLISAKSRKIVRKRKFLMYGGEAGLDESTRIDPITNSLDQGWQLEKFPTMNNALRAGTFNRGAQTELGGESVKWLLRASSNIVVASDDCGTKIGKPFNVTEKNFKKIIDFTILVKGESLSILNEDEAGTYIGKSIMIRSPMYCRMDKTDFCKACVGRKLSENPTGLSMTISEYGSAFLSLFMKAMHGKSLDMVKISVKESIT